MRRSLLVVAIVLAGCAAPAEPGPAAHERLDARETEVGKPLAFRVPSPVQGARYVWTFGDGGSTLATETQHAWSEPGVYVVAWQEMRGETVVRSSTGVVHVHQPLDIHGVAVPARPSEERFEVRENATSVALEFTAPAGVGSATAILVDPTGTPVATRILDLTEAVDVEFAAKDPIPGEWLLYVELPDGELRWAAKGHVRY